MTLAEYKRLLDPDERDWIDRLAGHAEDTGKSLETVLAEALIGRHRAALDLTEANQNLVATVSRLRK